MAENDIIYGGGMRRWRMAYPNGTSVTGSAIVTYPAYRVTKVRSLGPRPKGWKPPKPYSADFRKQWGPTGTVVYDFHSSGAYNHTFYSEGFSESPVSILENYYSVPDSVRERARVEALNDLQEQKVDLGAFLGEAKETASFLAGSFQAIISGYRSVKSGNWRSGMNTLKGQYYRNLGKLGRQLKSRNYQTWSKNGQLENLIAKGINKPSQAWLCYQWGIAPLVSDIHDIMAVWLGAEPWRAHMKATGSHSEQLDPRRIILGGNPNQTNIVFADMQATASSRCVLYAYPESSYFHDLGTIGLNNPIATIWELQTPSIVADKFFPISDVLKAMTAAQGLRFLGGCTSDRLRVETYLHGGKWSNGSRVRNGQSRLEGRIEQTTIYRSVHTKFPGAKFAYYKNPFQGQAGLLNAANLAALAGALLSGSKK